MQSGLAFLRIVFVYVGLSSGMCLGNAQEPTDSDLLLVETYIDRYGDLPDGRAVKRIVDAARSPNASPRILRAAVLCIEEGWSDERLAVDELATRGAASGEPKSLAVLGMEICGGKVPGKSMKEGIDLIRQASQVGEPLADYYLSLLNFGSVPGEIEQNLDLSETLARRAVAGGMLRGLNVLFKIAAKRGDREKYEAAVSEAAKAGDHEAMYQLYKTYAIDPVRKDRVHANYWAMRGVMFSNRRILVEYAIELDDGKEVEKDSVLAFRLLQRAVQMNSNEAKVLIEYGRIKGKFSLPRDLNKGLMALNEMGDRGMIEAKFMLGRMLVEGDGVDQDSAKGTRLLQEAAQSGFQSAKLYLDTNRREKQR